MTQDNQAAPCPACQAANLPGVKFCAQCGSPLTAQAPRVAPNPVAPVAAAMTTVADPMSAVRDALTRAGATVTGGDGQTTLDYQLAYSERLLGPMKLQFGGTVARSAQGHAVTARVLPQSLAMLFGSFVLGAVVAGFLPRTLISNEMYFGAVAITLGATVWIALSEGPKRARHYVEELIDPSSAGTAASAPASASMAAQAAAAGNAAPGGDVFAQLERLAQMQATGLLSAEDVATKKAELLARI